ncbi:MAG: hypothetical protein H6858_03040 [Rhodospirillales bacterium]|nr:hypothetical protein [Alphaproteobacteria bacterium]MCB1839936.1 hypothetical protein [Alphaproteobacteria bacterium]MCB9976559.1 hypothetical protein [Rhodospirillales bacterium]
MTVIKGKKTKKKKETPPEPDAGNEEALSQFSLFEGDLVNRAFAVLKIGGRSPLDLVLRMIIVIGITWVPMAMMSWHVVLPPGTPAQLNFFYDYAAYAQFLIGIPLFIIAERVVGEATMGAYRDFGASGVIADEYKEVFKSAEEDVKALRKRVFPEIACLAIAYILALCTILPELFWTSDMETWHVLKDAGGARMITQTGTWLMLVALPIQVYWWVRWVWKILIWYWFLSKISRFKLVLVASHPDHTGGIGFLSEVQAKFALVILAYGISNVVATIGYKIAIEHAPLDLPPVWGPLVGFAIIAPLLFLSPLLLFTKQLKRTKKRALAQFREKAMRNALKLEQEWLATPYDTEKDAVARNELNQLNLLTTFHDRITAMRVVPFDLRSAGQLIGSAIGPMIPLLPYFIDIPEPLGKILEALTKWLPH